MANTDVVLRDEMGLRVPSIPKVAITLSDTLTFSVENGADSVLYFSPDTAPILSPRPDSRVSLASGKTLIYKFAAAAPGSYGVITQAPEDPAPKSYDFGVATNPPVLAIQPGQGLDFPGPDNGPQGLTESLTKGVVGPDNAPQR